MKEEANQFLLSLIDLEAWNAAKWMATGFFVAVGSPLPPFLLVVFRNESAARDIFAGLRAKVGRDDEEELIRVSIVEGTFHGNPNAYAVNLGPDIKNVLKHFGVESPRDGYEDFLLLSRRNRMTPSRPSKSLALFKQQYLKTGRYYLMPGFAPGGQLRPVEELKIEKRSILFRRKEDISSGDLDTVVLE